MATIDIPILSRWRHKRRGTTYTAVAIGELQMSADDLCDGEEMMIYRSDDGKWWVRRREEFEDGRFDRISADQESAMTPDREISARLRRLAERITPRVPDHDRRELLHLADQVEALEVERGSIAAPLIPVLEPRIRED